MDLFEEHRPRLLRMAYRLLGSVAEAEDVVQDAYIRWQAAGEATNAGAYLSTIVTRLCLDVLKSARVKREQYVGQWLPDMYLEAGPEPLGALAHELSYGFMAMLERLTPEQRAVFVLRTAFDMEYGSIAETLGTSAASCRQLMRKARERMEGPARFHADGAESQALAERFAEACNTQDAAALKALLGEPCRFLSDGGGRVNAARRPVVGVANVCRLLLGLQRKYGLRMEGLARSSGTSPVLRAESQGIVGMAALDIDEGGAIVGVFFQWNPHKVSIERSHNA
ncbi:MAG: sigma-70 family RNA polymerase sigma factor [Myxococcota bacterium]